MKNKSISFVAKGDLKKTSYKNYKSTNSIPIQIGWLIKPCKMNQNYSWISTVLF